MLLKHVYMGGKFQRTLKLDISLSLEHFFISVPIFTQVASAPLRQKLKNGNLKTVAVGYVKRIYLMLDSYSVFLPFLTILFNFYVTLLYIVVS